MIRITDLGDPFSAPDTGAPGWPPPRTFQKLPPSELFDPGEPGEAGPALLPPPEATRGGQAVFCPPGYTRNPVPPYNCLSDVESGGELERLREEARREGHRPLPPLRVPEPVRSWTEAEYEVEADREMQEFREQWESTPVPPGPSGMPTGGLTPTPTPGGLPSIPTGGGGVPAPTDTPTPATTPMPVSDIPPMGPPIASVGYLNLFGLSGGFLPQVRLVRRP